MPPPLPGESGAGSPEVELTGSGREETRVETAAGPQPKKARGGGPGPRARRTTIGMRPCHGPVSEHECSDVCSLSIIYEYDTVRHGVTLRAASDVTSGHAGGYDVLTQYIVLIHAIVALLR